MLGELDVQPAGVVVTLHGEVDMLTIDELRSLLDSAVAASPARLVIDLTDVPFIDVLSLSAVLATADLLREHQATVTVVGASSSVRRVCSLLNADDVLAPEVPRPRIVAG